MQRHLGSVCGFVLALSFFVAVGCSKSTQPEPNPRPNPSDGGQVVQPLITVTAPARAAMLSDAPGVPIQGSMNVPADQIVSFKINGKDVTLEKDGSFTSKVSAEWGLNTITIDATDKNGVPARLAQSFLWSKDYQALNATRRGKAAMARINQKGLDDGNRGTLNDLASILEHLISKLDMDTLVPELLAEGEYKVPPIGPRVKYTVKKTGPLVVGRRIVTLTSRNDGIIVKIRLRDLTLPVHGKAGKILNKKADVKAEYVDITASVDIRVANDLIVVSIEKLDMDLTQMEVKAFSGVFGFLNKTVTKKVRQSMETKLDTLIRGLVPPLVKGFFEKLQIRTRISPPRDSRKQGSSLRLRTGLSRV